MNIIDCLIHNRVIDGNSVAWTAPNEEGVDTISFVCCSEKQGVLREALVSLCQANEDKEACWGCRDNQYYVKGRGMRNLFLESFPDTVAPPEEEISEGYISAAPSAMPVWNTDLYDDSAVPVVPMETNVSDIYASTLKKFQEFFTNPKYKGLMQSFILKGEDSIRFGKDVYERLQIEKAGKQLLEALKKAGITIKDAGQGECALGITSKITDKSEKNNAQQLLDKINGWLKEKIARSNSHSLQPVSINAAADTNRLPAEPARTVAENRLSELKAAVKTAVNSYTTHSNTRRSTTILLFSNTSTGIEKANNLQNAVNDAQTFEDAKKIINQFLNGYVKILTSKYGENSCANFLLQTLSQLSNSPWESQNQNVAANRRIP